MPSLSDSRRGDPGKSPRHHASITAWQWGCARNFLHSSLMATSRIGSECGKSHNRCESTRAASSVVAIMSSTPTAQLCSSSASVVAPSFASIVAPISSTRIGKRQRPHSTMASLRSP
eukprot:5425256-Prymnesium_polylepis.1